MKKYIPILSGTAFVLSICLLLILDFEASSLTIAAIIVFGLSGGILSRYFTGYVIPNRLIFRSRFIIHGIAFGIMIGLLLFFINSVEEQSFANQDLVKFLLICIPLGIIAEGIKSYLRFRKFKKKTNINFENQDSISDFAFYKDSERKTIIGRLLISDNKLSFYSMSTGACIFEMDLFGLSPVIKKSKFLNIPNGFSIQNEMKSVNVAYPYYWIKLIEAKKKKQPHNMQ